MGGRMENKSRELYIPVNTLDAEDYISGIRNREVAIIAMALVGATVLGIAMAALMNVISAVMAAASTLAIVIMVIRRDMCNENLIKKLRIVLAFIRRKKDMSTSILTFMRVRKQREENHGCCR